VSISERGHIFKGPGYGQWFWDSDEAILKFTIFNNRVFPPLTVKELFTSGKSNANLFYLMYPYSYLKLKLSRIKQTAIKEVFLKNKEISA
jgi:hypothetical protein